VARVEVNSHDQVTAASVTASDYYYIIIIATNIIIIVKKSRGKYSCMKWIKK
jgi:hypothetical protein